MEFKHTNLDIETEYPKLVRDRIPEIIKKNENIDIRTRTLGNDEEFLKYLLKKIVEEAAELQNAAVGTDVEVELADLYETIDAVLKVRGKTRQDIDAIEIEKREKNGGFEKRILMLGK
ncbi:MAG: nucleoside triphosphate pyrophosphohydrolase [Candidatus Pacebacteria bacterium]|jgi:predicted house-cleaning noncanonical NTP pyrophosphatase (MazG superfamily)|nr:nucleoside triphosphate pyrophosphohydrolase [Candidatus Paceibacterota bacterium]